MRAACRILLVGAFLSACTSAPQVTQKDAKARTCVALLNLGRLFAQGNKATTTDVDRAIGLLDDDANLLRKAGDAADAGSVEQLVQAIRKAGYAKEIAVFLSDSASSEDLNRIHSYLESSSGVTSVHYESKEEALRRFRELFKNEPKITRNVTAAALPASFNAQLADEAQANRIVTHVQSLPGVQNAAMRPGFAQVVLSAQARRSVFIRTCAV